jgi:hypothetical protein
VVDDADEAGQGEMTRAILIDPVAKTVSEAEIKVDNATLHKLVAVDDDALDIRMVDRRNQIVFDDNGLLRKGQHYFALRLPVWAWPYCAGKAVIIGCNQEGETVDCSLTLDEARAGTRFYSLQPVYRRMNDTTEKTMIYGRPGTKLTRTPVFDPKGVLENG